MARTQPDVRELSDETISAIAEKERLGLADVRHLGRISLQVLLILREEQHHAKQRELRERMGGRK